jgi:hypothetical protein
MQLRLHPRPSKSFTRKKIIIKTSLFISIFFLVIFLLDKMQMPVPNKLIEQEISNDKLITLK